MLKFITLAGILASLYTCDRVNNNFISKQNIEISSIKLYNFQSTIDSGAILYQKYCLSCHQKDGSGVPNMFPPLKNSNWVNGDPNRLIKNVLFGLSGEIEVNDEIYSQVMPKLDYLSDKQIAEILSYIRKNFGNNAKAVRLEEVKVLRKPKKK
jgi:mono/diheme cytochrome c family protein